MPETVHKAIAAFGVDIGKNAFHVVDLDQRGAIVLRQKWSRGQVEARFANLSPCLVGMEACVGAHHECASIVRCARRQKATFDFVVRLRALGGGPAPPRNRIAA